MITLNCTENTSDEIIYDNFIVYQTIILDDCVIYKYRDNIPIAVYDKKDKKLSIFKEVPEE